VEKLARQSGLASQDLRLLRAQGSRPVIDKLHAYLLGVREQLLPRSEAGQAVSYILKNWMPGALLLIPNTPAHLAAIHLRIGNSRTRQYYQRCGAKSATPRSSKPTHDCFETLKRPIGLRIQCRNDCPRLSGLFR